MSKEFFKPLETPNTVIQLGQANTVEAVLRPGEEFDFISFINSNQQKNLYFLAGIKEDTAGRAKDSDIISRNYIAFDFDLRKHGDGCSDEQLDTTIHEIIRKILSSERFKNYYAAINSGNGIHLYYLGDTIELTNRYELFSAGMKELVKEISVVAGHEADKACCNPARIMRIPGSYNNKNGRHLDVKLVDFNPTNKSKLLNELMDIGYQQVVVQAKFAQIQASTVLDSINTTSIEAYNEINKIPIGEIVCSILDWEIAGDSHFIVPGETKQKACFIAKDGNYILHGGTDHFSDKQKGYNPFQFIKMYYELDNKATFEWFRNRYEHLRIINDSDDANTPNNSLKKESKAMQAVEIIKKSGIKLFTDQFNEHWVSVNGDGTKVMRIDSNQFERLAFGLSMNNGLFIGSETYKAIKSILGYQAEQEKDKRNLMVRTAQDGDCFWYDLGEKAVRINKDGWFIDSPPIIFKRFQHQCEQVKPEHGGNIDDFISMINIEKESDKILLAVYLVSCFIPGFPHPILVLYGCQGSAKSSTFRMLKELIDPSSLSTLSLPKDSAQLVQIASHHWVSLFDNCSRITNDISDTICRVSTNEGSSKRKLYSDDDDVIYNLQHIIGLNGIGSVVSRPDLLHRSLLIEMATIDEQNRKDEAILKKQFQQIKPKTLGACLEAASKAMIIRDTVEVSWLPRMADFTKWGFAIADAIGIGGDNFIEAYKANIEEQTEEVVSSDWFCTVVMALVEKSNFEETPTCTLEKLNQIANSLHIDTYDKKWPDSPSWCVRRLREIAPTMKKLGIIISTGKKIEGQRMVSIKRDLESKAADLDTMDTKDTILYSSNDHVQEVLDMF